MQTSPLNLSRCYRHQKSRKQHLCKLCSQLLQKRMRCPWLLPEHGAVMNYGCPSVPALDAGGRPVIPASAGGRREAAGDLRARASAGLGAEEEDW